MDWTAVIERQGAALRRVVGALMAMVGPGTGAALRVPGAAAADRPTLARRRHRALLAVLRPAEAAARRLVVVMALAVLGPQAPAVEAGAAEARAPQAQQGRPRRMHQPRQPSPSPTLVEDGAGTGIVIVRLPSGPPDFGLAVGSMAQPPAVPPAWATPPADVAPPRALRLPLADPVRRLPVRRVATRDLPRLSVPGLSSPGRPRDWRPPTPYDRLDATRLVLRIEALAAALGDLPAEAKRFLRWRERRAERAARAEAPRPARAAAGGVADPEALAAIQRHRRAAMLRAGRPPGWRRRPRHEVEEILADLHMLVLDLLRRPDTS